MTPHFIFVKIGCNDIIVKEKVRKRCVLKIFRCLPHHNPEYDRYVLTKDAVNALPENGVLLSVIVYYGMDKDVNGENK